MYSDENKSSSLAKFLNPFDYVMIDTCSLMEEAFAEWMDALANAKEYRKKGQPILVPRRCYDELKKHARQRRDDSRRINAKRGLKILRKAKWQHLLAVTKKDKTENFADNAIYVKVCADRLFAKILVITQDKSLASDLRALNQLKSQAGRPLEVCKVIPGGRLVPNKGEENPYREYKGTKEVPNPKSTGNAPTSGVEAVLAADARLSAVLGNPNYPEEKKKADALAQIRALEKLNDSTLAQLSLLVPLPRLKEVAGLAPKAAPAPKKAPEKKPEPAPKAEKKPAEAKEGQPQKERLWYGTGKTLSQALADCAEHYHLTFREPTTLYFPEAHGPMDWTQDDLVSIEAIGMAQIRGEEKISFTYRGVTFYALQTPEKFKAWIDVNQLPKDAAPAEKPKPAPKPKAAKKTAEAEEAKPEEKPAPKKTPKAKAPKKEEAAGEEQKEKPSEPKAKTRKAPAKKTAEPKEEEPKEEAKPAKKPAAKKPAKPAEPKEEQPVSPELNEALRAERRLRANVNNGNYPLESKIRDVEAQIERVKALSPEDAARVGLGVEALEAKLESLRSLA